MHFQDRADAGRKLAKALKKLNLKSPIVLGLARGGLPVAKEVADELDAPLDVIVVRKLGAPSNPEFGFGAITQDNTLILDTDTVDYLGLSKEDIAQVILKEKYELKRREREYRGDKKPIKLKAKTVIIIDDGLATGVSAHAAIKFVKKHKPKQIIFACPVGALDSAKKIKGIVDKIICLYTPENFSAVGQWYVNFNQINDHAVVSILQN